MKEIHDKSATINLALNSFILWAKIKMITHFIPSIPRISFKDMYYFHLILRDYARRNNTTVECPSLDIE